LPLYVLEIKAGGAAEKAATRKHATYSGLQRRYSVVPVTVNTLGPMNEK